jgi:Cu2+-containing amine oxidase
MQGVRVCSSPAKTILESGTDAGNFRGLAIFVDGPEVVLVSEMSAGWYRYISEWRLHADGTIRPRFGFAGTENRCTCHAHIHHVYWRLDFDIRTAGHNTVEEFNDPPIFPGTNWHTKTFEIRRPRDASHARHWRVKNTLSGEAYSLIPGAADGAATPYGVGDLWVLRYNAGEIDDGQGFTTDPGLSRAHIDPFLTPPEAVTDTDVVLWYAAHFLHDQAHESGAKVGPDLLPSGW